MSMRTTSIRALYLVFPPRMWTTGGMLYVISDLHLDERGPPQMFSDERQGRALKALCERIARDEGAELILLGDTFDLTSMLPPKHGLERFFRKLDVPREPPPRRPLPELLKAIRESNPVTFDALATLGKRARITIVPGNHDHWIDGGTPFGFDAGVEKWCQRVVGGKLIV